MAIYATRNDLEIVFGADNVKQWANLEGDNDYARIGERILYALETASTELEDILRGRRYTFPLTHSKTLRDLVVRMAALRLYDARGVIDGDPQADKLSVVRAGVDKTLSRIRRGEITLQGDITTSIPTITENNTPPVDVPPFFRPHCDFPDPFRPFRP